MGKNLFVTDLPYSVHYNSSNLLDISTYSNTVILDLFDTISYIVYTDFYTPRDEDSDNKKKLSVKIPVNNLSIFQNIKKDLNTLLNYMTNGEKWDIDFYETKKLKKIENNQLINEKINYNSIALLSGGLDSLSGTTFEKDNNTIFVSFETNNTELVNAKKIYDDLVKSTKNKHVIIKKIHFHGSEHYTERTRSLMFIACCLVYADYYNINTINLYENGIMSLNPKFNFSRRVTKTTNQKTLYLVNKIFEELDIKVRIDNPFKYKTKADIINFIPEKYFEYVKDNTRTCSKSSGVIHFRNKSKGNFHCGVCIACILRQIGIHYNDLDNFDSNYCLPKELLKFENIMKYEEKISKSKNSKNDMQAAMYKFNEKRSLIFYYKQYKEKIDNNTIYNYLDLKKEYYLDDNWIENIGNMLKKFSIEIDKYLSIMK